MIHTIKNAEEIRSFLKDFEKDEIVKILLDSVLFKSKDLTSKILLFQNDKEKILIHFNNVVHTFEKRQDLNCVFFMYFNSVTGDFDLKRFMNGGDSIKETTDFLKEKFNKSFSDYVSCEIYCHLNNLDKNYKEKNYFLITRSQ